MVTSQGLCATHDLDAFRVFLRTIPELLSKGEADNAGLPD
jgi:hypothetical protein